MTFLSLSFLPLSGPYHYLCLSFPSPFIPRFIVSQPPEARWGWKRKWLPFLSLALSFIGLYGLVTRARYRKGKGITNEVIEWDQIPFSLSHYLGIWWSHEWMIKTDWPAIGSLGWEGVFSIYLFSIRSSHSLSFIPSSNRLPSTVYWLEEEWCNDRVRRTEDGLPFLFPFAAFYCLISLSHSCKGEELIQMKD